jgi:hypothetical protein
MILKKQEADWVLEMQIFFGLAPAVGKAEIAEAYGVWASRMALARPPSQQV